ncbi:MAG TPA: MAPEG family protein [Allosphingosinicella sp.]|nr:MAPEG family protein [Allosphingosinicella sp.]
MIAALGVLASASATLLIVAFYFFTGMRVGILRGRHGIKAPLCAGHPEFDRAYRVHLNTLEQMAITLPLLWVATLFPIGPDWLPGAIGLVWVLGRILYLRAYMADPEKRLIGAAMSGLLNILLLLLGIAGLVSAWLALR